MHQQVVQLRVEKELLLTQLSASNAACDQLRIDVA